jgi:hypothetical protein
VGRPRREHGQQQQVQVTLQPFSVHAKEIYASCI